MKRRQDEDLMRQQDLIEKQKEQTRRRSQDQPDTRSESGSLRGSSKLIFLPANIEVLINI